MSTENSSESNQFESSHPQEQGTTTDLQGPLPTQALTTEPDSNLQFVNPHTLISRQTPREMSSSKLKKLRKKLHQQGFDSQQPIEVADVDGKLIIVDGHHRTAVAKQLKIKSVPIRRQKVSSSQEELLLLQAAEAQNYQQY